MVCGCGIFPVHFEMEEGQVQTVQYSDDGGDRHV